MAEIHLKSIGDKVRIVLTSRNTGIGLYYNTETLHTLSHPGSKNTKYKNHPRFRSRITLRRRKQERQSLKQLHIRRLALSLLLSSSIYRYIHGHYPPRNLKMLL
jgi:hypothetical protein